MQAGEVREMPAARPYLDRGRRQVLAEPLPVAGRRLVTGDVEIGHVGGPQRRDAVAHHGGELRNWPVKDLLPVAEHDLLVWPAGRPDHSWPQRCYSPRWQL